MVTDEATCKGTVAMLISAVHIYDTWQCLSYRHSRHDGRRHWYNVTSNTETAAVIEIWPYYVSRPDAYIIVQAKPQERSLMTVWCEEENWEIAETGWRDLLAELRRLGYIEAGEAEPEPVATEAAGRSGGKPSKQPIKYRAFWVHKLQESGLSAELFVVSEAGQGFSNGPEQLRRYAKEPEVIAYIEAHFHHRLEAK